MATIAALVPPIVSKSSALGANAGQQVGYVAAAGGGDLISLSGVATLFSIKTTGTASTVTLDSVVPSNYGIDQNITMVLAATDEQHILIKTDGRMDQGGANTGLMAITYTSVTGVSVRAVTIPGM